MSSTAKPTVTNSKTTQINIEQSNDDLANLPDGQNKSLVIILAVTLPTLALIGIVILLVICYRRRHATIWLKKLEHSNRLQAIVVNLSSTPIQAELAGKKPRLSYRPFAEPHTETIVYNRLSTPPTPVLVKPSNPLKAANEGETNEAFDDYLIRNEPAPILRSSLGQPTKTLYTEFPVSLQAPVRAITSTLVEAIATHRLSLIVDPSNNTSSSLETTTTTSSNPNQRHSGASSSYSSTSQTVLLFSQRTEL